MLPLFSMSYSMRETPGSEKFHRSLRASVSPAAEVQPTRLPRHWVPETFSGDVAKGVNRRK